MSRPGPKPNNGILNTKRIDIIEQLLRHLLTETTDRIAIARLRGLAELKCSRSHRNNMSTKQQTMPNSDSLKNERLNIIEQLVRHILTETTDETTSRLLRSLEECQLRHSCTKCPKSYTDAKGLRRHILASKDDPLHKELADQLCALECRWCRVKFRKREQVTKHESRCKPRRQPIQAQFSSVEPEPTQIQSPSAEPEPTQIQPSSMEPERVEPERMEPESVEREIVVYRRLGTDGMDI